MARELSKMDAARSQTKVGRHATGEPGLYVQVAQGRDKLTRAWILRYMIAGQARQMGLGSLDVMPTTEARRRAMKARLSIRDGIDPLAEKEGIKEAAKLKRARTKTFAECAAEVIAKKTKETKNAKHQAQWKSTLETYAHKIIGEKSVDAVTKHDVLAILSPIWDTKHETASRVRGRIEAVFDYAKAMGYCEGDNPAEWKGNLAPILGKGNAATKKHQPSLPYAEIAKFVAALRDREGMAAMALEFGILCAARSGEVLGATWDEIDIEAKLWTIPADRMKAKREHTIPLTDAALAVLAKASALRQADVPYVFPALRGGKLSDMALSMLIRRMNGDSQFVDGRTRDPIVPHGFRSTFRDWAGETTAHPREVIEHALAHQLKDKAEAAYQRGNLLGKRRNLMNDWAAYCARNINEGNNVVAIEHNFRIKTA